MIVKIIGFRIAMGIANSNIVKSSKNTGTLGGIFIRGLPRIRQLLQIRSSAPNISLIITQF